MDDVVAGVGPRVFGHGRGEGVRDGVAGPVAVTWTPSWCPAACACRIMASISVIRSASFPPPTHSEPQPPPTYGSCIHAVLLGTVPSAKILTRGSRGGADRRSAARAEPGERTGELFGGARHSGGKEQHAHAGGQFAVREQAAVDVEGLRAEGAPHDPVAAGAEPRLGVAGHAEPGERGESRPDRVGPLLAAERRQRVLDEGLGAFVEEPGRLSGRVRDDGPAGRRDGVPVDPHEPERLGVDPSGVPGEGVQDDGVVRAHRVEVAPRGQPRRIGHALVEAAGVPAVPGHPLPAGRPPDGVRHRRGHVGQRREAGWPTWGRAAA